MTAPIPDIAGKEPVAVELEAGKTYFWCACGRSATQPFCDGSHKGTAFEPLKFIAEKSGTAWLCACKRSADKPYCNGTHKSL
ncbi:MAG TPA: CDGSH iron-sulfur domain-containing protein [Rhodocyclaceae bacterium]|nr:CDGSH iron-sulfur domain-containing protein [Rhodocyclaceae bacterium]HRQ47081.1 CDGSH iron-sulfur domain-containing protein [Rhodocyclaceae bacterium]